MAAQQARLVRQGERAGVAGDDPVAVFTGDTLFAGSVGRTDLYGEEEQTKQARELYSSLHEKLLPLGNHVIIYPAHGSGSLCGHGIKTPSVNVRLQPCPMDLLEIVNRSVRPGACPRYEKEVTLSVFIDLC